MVQKSGLAVLTGCGALRRSSAADVAADSHQQLWHAEALLAAERDRVRLLENQLADATARCEGAMAELSTAQAETRSARSDGADAGRRVVHADAHVKTLQGRVKVLEAQVEAAVLFEADLRGNVQQLEGEQRTAAASAAKEHSSLSSALRAARARCGRVARRFVAARCHDGFGVWTSAARARSTEHAQHVGCVPKTATGWCHGRRI